MQLRGRRRHAVQSRCYPRSCATEGAAGIYRPKVMPQPIQDTISRLLRYKRAALEATSRFSSWKHNADILPRLQEQLEMLLDAYGKFEPIVYDTQGIRDDGSDVVLRYRPEKSETGCELICFQVKSFDDLAKKTYMQELKAQRDDSFRKVRGMRHYFLLLCTDGKAHKEKLRNVMAEFRSADRTEVIEPDFAYTFLHHPKTRVEAFVKRTMETEDFVLRHAEESLDLPSPSARALAVFMTVRSVFGGLLQFTTSQLLGEPALRNIYGELSEDDPHLWQHDDLYTGHQHGNFEDQLAEDISILENDLVDVAEDTQAVSLRTEQLRPLSAVVADALARYEYDEQSLVSYMFALMGVRD
jgi:hypothetical protein